MLRLRRLDVSAAISAARITSEIYYTASEWLHTVTPRLNLGAAADPEALEGPAAEVRPIQAQLSAKTHMLSGVVCCVRQNHPDAAQRAEPLGRRRAREHLQGPARRGR